MKILYITTISNTINSFLVPHIRFLKIQGHAVDVAFNTIEDVHLELLELGCEVYSVPFQRNPLKKENLTAYRMIRAIIIKGKYDLIHVHTPVASFVTRLACRNLENLKIFYTAHGFHFSEGGPKASGLVYYSLEKWVSRWTDVLITMNDEDYQAARKFNLRNNNSTYKVHGVGIDLNRFIPQTTMDKELLRKEYKYSQNDFILIYVGELSYRKQQDLIIKAIERVRKSIPNIKLLLVGDGELSVKYKQLINELGLENNVELLGHRNDISNLMTISDIAVSTSRREGLPVNVMEAMATGLPIIVTDCRGNRDLVQNEKNGMIIKHSVKDCADAIESLYNSQELREKFGENNKIIIKQFSLDNVMKEMKQIYNEQSVSNEFLNEV